MKPTTTHDNGRATASHGSVPKRPRQKRARGPRVPEASREAKRIAASILEVLAGASSPTAAAAALKISLPRFYLLERLAMEGLITACEPRSGRAMAPHREVDVLRKQLERVQRDAARYQTLLRVAQRTIGLAPPTATSDGQAKRSGKTKRRRRLSARALVAARTLRAGIDDEATDAPRSDTNVAGHRSEGTMGTI